MDKPTLTMNGRTRWWLRLVIIKFLREAPDDVLMRVAEYAAMEMVKVNP